MNNTWDKAMGKMQTGLRIEDTEPCRVGDIIHIQGRSLYVMETEMVFAQNIMKCSCTAYPRQCFEVQRIPASTLRSTVLTGKILETRQELVKIHLDIDSEQPPSQAYEFSWKPITGNMLYCMPKVGTRAALYVSGFDERTAAVIYNIRENGKQNGELADCSNRYFTTDYNKRMYLKPSEMGLLNMDGHNAEIALRDKAVLNMKTASRISIMAQGQVELKGKNVTMTTPKEATLVRKDLISPAVINMCNAFDAIGKTGNFAPVPQLAEKKRSKGIPGTSQKTEEYQLQGAVETILSNIPAVGTDSPVMEAVAGSLPIITNMKHAKA